MRTHASSCRQLLLCLVFFSLMDGVTSMSLEGSRMALTHSINLELNNFLLPAQLSIVFVQLQVFDEGTLERRTFLPEKGRAWVQVC